MTTIFIFILIMLGIGFFARKYDGRVRLLLMVSLGAIVLYTSLK